MHPLPRFQQDGNALALFKAPHIDRPQTGARAGLLCRLAPLRQIHRRGQDAGQGIGPGGTPLRKRCARWHHHRLQVPVEAMRALAQEPRHRVQPGCRGQCCVECRDRRQIQRAPHLPWQHRCPGCVQMRNLCAPVAQPFDTIRQFGPPCPRQLEPGAMQRYRPAGAKRHQPRYVRVARRRHDAHVMAAKPQPGGKVANVRLHPAGAVHRIGCDLNDFHSTTRLKASRTSPML